MKRILSILFIIPLLSLGIVRAQGISGPWRGDLDLGTTKLAIVFHFDPEGCTMDSPDQGAKGLPAEITFISKDSVAVEQKAYGVSYSGKLSDGKIEGRFSQRGMYMPLVLVPGDVVRLRPQTPKEPYPYKTEEVTFANGDATFSGTLTWPEKWNGRKKVPVAIMVTGSGQQNRDEEIMDHKPFLVISDYLARHGVATLRYDDRGTGKSTGDPANSTTEDNMYDAAAGLDYLRSVGKFNKVGVIGHSEGGEIAFMLGARGKVDFLVSLAGPGVQGDSILLLQNINALRKSGMVMNLTKEFIRGQIKAQNNPWLNFFIDYDPVQDIRMLRCPALILNGGKDTQVEAAVNIPSIEANLPRDRYGRYLDKRTKLIVYPGLNHLFQHCGSGQVEEYSAIEETFAPLVLSNIASWIKGL